MNKLRQIVDTSLASACILALAVLACAVIYQVIARFIFNSPSTTIDEMSQIIFMWLILLGATYTAGQNKHLAIDLLKDRLTGMKKQFLLAFINLVILAFGIIFLLYGGVNMISKSAAMGQISPALGWQMKYIYYALPISGTLLCFYATSDLVQLFTVEKPVSTNNTTNPA